MPDAILSQPTRVAKTVEEPTSDSEPLEETPPDGPGAGLPRWLLVAGGLLAVGFVLSVVMSTRSAPVPVAPSGSMHGMSMDAGPLALMLLDSSGRVVRLPDGRPSVVISAQAGDCVSCIAAVRAARDAVNRAADKAQLIVILASSKASKVGLAAFLRGVGSSSARYVINRPGSNLAAVLGSPGVGAAVVYDARGSVVARPRATAPEILAALRGAGR